MKVIILFLLSITAMASNGSLTLDDALKEAHQTSTHLQQADALAREAKWKRVEAMGGFLPQLSISGNHFFTQQYEFLSVSLAPGNPLQFPIVVPQTTINLDAKLTLFDGFQNIYSYSAASFAQDAAERDADWANFQVAQDIKAKFYDALAAQELASVADQNLKTLADHIEKVKVRRQGGVATKFDVLRVEVQWDDAQSEKLSSDDNVQTSKQRLAEAIGTEDAILNLKGELPIPNLNFIKNSDDQDLTRRNDIEAINLRAMAADKRQTAASSFWVPKFSLGYEYTFYNNQDFSFTTPFGNAYLFGVFVNWNIFDGAVSLARHKEAAEETRIAEISKHAAQLKFKTDIQTYKRSYAYNTKLYAAKSADVEKAQESVRLAQEGLKEGTRTSSEVLDAELDLFRARAGRVQAQVSAAKALINLELALGKNL